MDPNDSNRRADPADPGRAVPGAPPNPLYASSARDAARRKRCPQCAEDVSAAAHICRFCGYSFDDGSTAEGRAAVQAHLNTIEAARLVKGGRKGFYLRVLRVPLSLLLLLFVFAMIGAMLLNEISQIGHLTRTPVPTGPHPSPTAAKTLSIAPSAYFSGLLLELKA